jgi:4-diphosphocytidyl-2-C-methyl-D-erythritol kinase
MSPRQDAAAVAGPASPKSPRNKTSTAVAAPTVRPCHVWLGSRSAPAKVNLSLEVCGLHSDGFHSIRSVMVCLELADRLDLRVTYEAASPPDDATMARSYREGAAPTRISLEVLPGNPLVPTDATNLVVRAAEAMLGHWPADQELPAALEFVLHKEIPTQGGLGGGSADAAAALHLLDSLTLHAVARETLADVAARLGSDVPLAFYGGAALCEGRGEQLTPVAAQPLWLVLVRPDLAISTPWCYQAFDALHLGPDHKTRRDAALAPAAPRQHTASLLHGLAQGDSSVVGAHLFNDLQSPVLAEHPHLTEVLAALRAAGCAGAVMSGSGSCFFGVTSTREQAEQAAAALQGAGLGSTWVTRTVQG